MTESEGRRKPRHSLLHASRATEVTYLDRIDPLFEVKWIEAASAEWTEVSTFEHRLGINASGEIIPTIKRDFSPVRQPPAVLYSPGAICTVAWLTQFHQASTMQLATLLGVPAQRAERIARGLYAAGILTRARPAFWHDDDYRPRGGTGALWALHRKEQFSYWLEGLSPLEHLLMSGGVDLTRKTQGSTGLAVIRHNLMTSEVALRALESCPGLLGVWGETHATTQLLLGESTMKLPPGIADMVFVDRTGRVIVVEVSGASNIDKTSDADRLASKASSWAAVAARTNLDLCVLFLDVSQKPRPQRFWWHVKRGVDAANKYLVHASDRRKAASRVFVADAHDWFPIESCISEGFSTFEARSVVDELWYDIITTSPEVNKDSDVAVNSLAALHTPSWVVRQPQPI